MNFSSAYLLVSHGSRDPRPQLAIEHLAKLVSRRLSHCRPPTETVTAPESLMPLTRSHGPSKPLSHHPSEQPLGHRPQSRTERMQPLPPVGTAVLEFAPLPLHQQVQQFGQRVFAAGYRHLNIVPLFLLPGVHVMDDIPAEVAIAQRSLSSLSLTLCPHLGSYPQLRQLISPPPTWPATIGRVLLSHGSRRAEGNADLEAIAAELDAVLACWSTPPSLADQVRELVQRGHDEIGVMPYFLFEGGITDAIAHQVEELRQVWADVRLHLGSPIGATASLADLLVELLAPTNPD